MINIHIEAYGAVTQFLPRELYIEVKEQQPIQVEQILHAIIAQYPQAEQAVHRCACAIGEDIIARQARLERDCTLVLLSPVAGG